MTKERVEEIFEEEKQNHWHGDNAFFGLKILEKYIDPREEDLITGAQHDQIFSIGVEDAVNAGLTEEDVIKLREYNWMIEEDAFSCFV